MFMYTCTCTYTSTCGFKPKQCNRLELKYRVYRIFNIFTDIQALSFSSFCHSSTQPPSDLSILCVFYQDQKAKEEVEAIANAPPPQTTEETEAKAEVPPTTQETSEVDIDLTDPEVQEAATKIQVSFL